jgi:hypothetical protein
MRLLPPVPANPPVVATARDAVDASGDVPARHRLRHKRQRGTVDSSRALLEGLVEVDETDAPLRSRISLKRGS